MGPVALYDGRPKEYIYGKQTASDSLEKLVHNGVVYSDTINSPGSGMLVIDTTGPIPWDFTTPERIYGIELYVIGSEQVSGATDYRHYTGAVKNIGGTLSIVGAGFTEIVIAQDAALWNASITVSSSGASLQVKISNAANQRITLAARYEIISNGMLP